MTTAKRRVKSQTVTVEQLSSSGVLYGSVAVVHPAIKRIGCKWIYDHRLHAYKIPKRHLDAVLVEIEKAGHVVQVQMPGWS